MRNRSARPVSPFHDALLLFAASVTVAIAQTPPDEILLKDYKPRSIFKIPATRIEKARYGVIDVHSHAQVPLADARVRPAG